MSMELLDKSGLAYFWTKIKAYIAGLLGSKADDSDVVHKAGDESVTGTKTFVGSKKVAFKQSAANDKLGFTLFSNSNVEQGYLEYNPTNKISGVPLMTLGNYATAAAGRAYVGFRKYSSISGANGAYNLLAPLISDAKAPFNLTTTYTNFFLPLGVTDGTTIVVTDKSGLLDISSLLVSVDSSDAITAMTGYSKPSSGGAIAVSDSLNAAIGKLEFKVDSVDDSNYVHLSGDETVGGNKTFSNTISGSIDGNAATASAVAWSGVTGKPTTISGYGITDAKIDNGTITLGSNSITPLTSHQTLPTLSRTISGSGNAITDITVSGHAITATKGSTFLTSHQDISGKVNKSGDTMTGDLTVPSIYCKYLFVKNHPAVTKGTNPSSDVWWTMTFCDKNGVDYVQNCIGMFETSLGTTGVTNTYMRAMKNQAGVASDCTIGCAYDAANDKKWTYAPTPPIADNSTQIATTEFVKAQGYLTSHQDISGKVNKSGDIMTGDLTVTTGSANQIRLLHGNYSVLLRNDGWSFWILQTASGDPWGGWNDARPFYIDLSSGLCYINGRLPDPIPVGSIIYHASGAVPTGYLLCNGGAVSRTTYAALFNVIGTTFGAGDGWSTFNVPNLIGKFVEGDTVAGTVKYAGLPNITGQMQFRRSGGGASNIVANSPNTEYSSGALKVFLKAGAQWRESLDTSGSNTAKCDVVNIDASLSNSIYGSSSTVQPPALTLVPCIRYA